MKTYLTKDGPFCFLCISRKAQRTNVCLDDRSNTGRDSNSAQRQTGHIFRTRKKAKKCHPNEREVFDQSGVLRRPRFFQGRSSKQEGVHTGSGVGDGSSFFIVLTTKG